MNEGQKKYTLYIDGQAVPVSEQVYRAYHHYARKEGRSDRRGAGRMRADPGGKSVDFPNLPPPQESFGVVDR